MVVSDRQNRFGRTCHGEAVPGTSPGRWADYSTGGPT